MLNQKIRCFVLSALLVLPFDVLADSSLTLSTWNIEWLSSSPSDQFVQSQRTTGDYLALEEHFSLMKSDVLAFQEVNDEAALQKVIGKGYDIVFSDRTQERHTEKRFHDINQFTGVAIKHGINWQDMPDVLLDQRSNSKLRFATYVVIQPNSERPIHLLSVHLKARCSGAYKNNRDCRILKQQGERLNQWINEKEVANQAYVILGDFNHNLSYPNDWLWNTLTQSNRAQLATQRTRAECKVRSRKQPNKTHRFRSLIDHIIVSDQIKLSAPKQDVYPSQQVLKHQLSDHCPITAQLY